jgi:hypothetical protein
MHKGFNCLDVAAGRVYISRDIVFDESVYPFSKLNPNAGVHLRSEVLLLPNHIQPNNLPTPRVELIDCSNINAPVIPVTANVPLSSGQIAEISTSNDEATLGVRRPQSCADQIVGADQIAATEGPVTQSCADQIVATGNPATQSCADQIICADQIAVTGGPVTQSCADQIVCADQIAATEGPATQSRADQIGGHVPVPDFSPSISSVPLPAIPVRPSTCLQHGIRKTKVYTDGTIRYGLLISSGEPNHLDEALGDSRWKSAMDQEYIALLKNNTWHLVSRKQGMNVIDCK